MTKAYICSRRSKHVMRALGCKNLCTFFLPSTIMDQIFWNTVRNTPTTSFSQNLGPLNIFLKNLVLSISSICQFLTSCKTAKNLSSSFTVIPSKNNNKQINKRGWFYRTLLRFGIQYQIGKGEKYDFVMT